MDKTRLKMAMSAMSSPQAVVSEVAKRLGITTATLYVYLNGDGSLKEAGNRLLAEES